MGRGRHVAEQRLVERLLERREKRRVELGGGAPVSPPPSFEAGVDEEVEEGLLDVTADEGIALCAEAAIEGWRGEGRPTGEEGDEPELTGTLADEEGNVAVLDHDEVTGILLRRR